ncbi:MAG TPA: efflux RND transporter periplasmic adaptor subunit, partial [Rikenellaceae bacterium]|nr:efflux RND transporter periplasmic adaptor subunit [Rikenellaceae bacterium]
MELFKKSGILIVLGLLSLLSSCGSKPHKHQKLPLPVNVRVHTVSETTLGSEREYVGVLEESNNVLLSFPTPGKIKNVYVKEGQEVREGQLLAQTDAELLENMHATTAAALRQAEDAYQRMTLLYESQSLPEIQYIDIQTKLEQ